MIADRVTPAVLGRRRATRPLPVRPTADRGVESQPGANPKDLPDGSDVTAQTAGDFDSERRLLPPREMTASAAKEGPALAYAASVSSGAAAKNSSAGI